MNRAHLPLLVLLAAAQAALAAPFTAGNVVVYRVGNGNPSPGGNLVATGNPVFLDEYTANGTKVQSIALPTAANGTQRALVASGTATTDGLMTRSADGACLVLPGYGRDLGTGSGNLATTGTVAGGGAIPRVVARVSPQGVVDTTTALTDASVQSNFRGAASSDCSSLWVSGTAATTGGGVRYATVGSTTSTDLTSGSFANTRAVVAANGQLYASASVTALRTVASVGAGLPASGAQTVAALPGLPAPAANGQPYAFFFASADVLYVADESFGIQKFSLVAGAWIANGTSGLGADAYRGIAGTVSAGTVTLFATRKGGSTATGGGELVMLIDSSGPNGALTGSPALVATAPANTAFRGLAMAPVSPPPPTFTVTPSAGANGGIDPSTPQTVFQGATFAFTLSPAAGYASGPVGGTCGGTLVGDVFTTSAITASCTVSAAFTPLPHYTVSVATSGNGTVDAASLDVVEGTTGSLAVTPAAGYNAAVRGTCGGSFSGSTWVTKPVTANCTLEVTFAKRLVLFVGNSYTFGRVDPVMSYNAAHVADLTLDMWLANANGSNEDEPHPWGGIPGVFKKMADQRGLEYDVSISARNAASLRGHYLNTNPAGWDLRGNITSQRFDAVVLQELSDGALPAGRGANANLANFNTYVDLIEQAVHANYSPAQVFLYETWARPDSIGPNGSNADGLFYTAAEGIEGMTADLHASYFNRAAANPHIEDVSPVGDAFLRAVTDGVAMRDPYVPDPTKVNLWHTDYFHPSKYGSYLSAAVHFHTLTGINPLVLGPNEQAAADLGIAPDIAVKLQRVAQAVVSPDTTAPVTVASVSEAPNAAGWNRGDVTVSFSASDDVALDSIRYSLDGAQAGNGVFGAAGSITIGAEGVTTITYYAVDRAGNAEVARTLRVAIDRTPPAITGMPANCSIWPPNNKMVAIATVAAGGGDSGLSAFSVSATSNEAQTKPKEVDIEIAGSGLAPRAVSLRASRDGSGSGRVYTIVANATDAAGNSSTATATCLVPHNQ
jgi:hypothetical protein